MRKTYNISKVLDISLTRSCNYNCTWCNQRYDLTRPMHDMNESPRVIVKNGLRGWEEWIKGLNANPYKGEYDKVIFSGGEPSLHPDFIDIVAGVKGYRCKIVVTNLSFDVEKLIDACRAAGSSVIVQPSFHFEFADFGLFLKKIKVLDRNNMLSHFIPVSIVDLPDRKEPSEYGRKFRRAGYEAFAYRFEGYYKGKFIYADVKGFGSLGEVRRVSCSSSSHHVSPNGDIVFCATDTYCDMARIYGNICDQIYEKIEPTRVCSRFGSCHISSASWIKVESLDKKETIWRGKNFFRKDLKNRVRLYCENRNYPWLGRAKRVYNNFSSIMENVRK